MSEYKDITQGLSEALAYVKGENANVRVMTVTTKKRASVHPKQILLPAYPTQNK